MKIGIIGDIHFSEYSSILRSRGEKFSTRLENCIDSINYAEDLTKTCDLIVYMGDFFDKSSLNASELTALSNIKWNNVVHMFLVGNHEMGINNLLLSSAHVFNVIKGSLVIDKPVSRICEDTELCFLPYVLEENRENSIFTYFDSSKAIKRIIFSHNDISGIQLGQFISKAGFEINDIENNCDLFINGHLHNRSKITDKIINVGNLTGQNFSEDGFKYDHIVSILDTQTLNIEIYENPYAINFYKLETIDDINKINKKAAITVRVKEEEVSKAKKLIENNKNIIASRVIVDFNSKEKKDIKTLSVDHLNEFRKFVLSEIGDSELIREELDIIDG